MAGFNIGALVKNTKTITDVPDATQPKNKLEITYQAGRLTSRVEREIREALSGNLDTETICRFISDLVTEWNLCKVKNPDEVIPLEFDALTDEPLEGLGYVLALIVKDMTDQGEAEAPSENS